MSLNHIVSPVAALSPTFNETKTQTLQVVSGAGVGLVLKSDASGNATWQSASGAAPVVSISANVQLTVAQSGTVFTVPAQSADLTATLPPVAGSAGVSYKFVFQTANNHAFNVNTTSLENTLAGTVTDNSGGAGSGTPKISFFGTPVGAHVLARQGNGYGNVGDTITATSDGVWWFLTGYSGGGQTASIWSVG